MLLDDKGNPLTSEEQEKKQREINIRRIYAEVLNEMAPKTEAEQEAFWREFLLRVFKREYINRQVGAKTGFDGLFTKNYKKRVSGEDNSMIAQGKTGRHIASIPPEIVPIAKKVYGDDVMTNPKTFRKAFVEDEFGRNCLTVDPKSL